MHLNSNDNYAFEFDSSKHGGLRAEFVLQTFFFVNAERLAAKSFKFVAGRICANLKRMPRPLVRNV